ncbi:hypothetical protein [Microcoleus sp. B13-B6]|uniref:hypothetical protein n=1 Tax=Microcoleus sp. B13-B6 TaxID=2818652 RepID=UPI002FD16D9B
MIIKQGRRVGESASGRLSQRQRLSLLISGSLALAWRTIDNCGRRSTIVADDR